MRPRHLLYRLRHSGIGYALTCVLIVIVERFLRGVLPDGVPLPQLLLVLALVRAMQDFTYSGAATCFFIGLLQDAASGAPLGSWASSFVLLYTIVAGGFRLWFGESALTAGVLAGLLCAPVHFFQALAAQGLLTLPQIFTNAVWPAVFTECLLTALISPIVYSIMSLRARNQRVASLGGVVRYA